MNTDTKQQIEAALLAFSGADLRAASIGLLNSLGYQSEKTLDLDNTPDAFLAEFDKRDREFRKDKALFERWKTVEFKAGFNKEIDNKVYTFYDLIPDEIAIVEGK